MRDVVRKCMRKSVRKVVRMFPWEGISMGRGWFVGHGFTLCMLLCLRGLVRKCMRKSMRKVVRMVP